MGATASSYSPATGLRVGCHRLAQHPAAALFLPPHWRAARALVLPHQQSPNKLPAWKPIHPSPCILRLQEQGHLPPAQHGSSSPSPRSYSEPCALHHCLQLLPTLSSALAPLKCPSPSPTLVLSYILSLFPSFTPFSHSSPSCSLSPPSSLQQILSEGLPGTVHCVYIKQGTRSTELLPQRANNGQRASWDCPQNPSS